jgi:hypothetical protein
MTTRERLHQLVDQLPEQALEAAEEDLERRRDSVAWLLANAPPDDEPPGDGEAEAIAEALADPAPRISHTEIRREFGP